MIIIKNIWNEMFSYNPQTNLPSNVLLIYPRRPCRQGRSISARYCIKLYPLGRTFLQFKLKKLQGNALRNCITLQFISIGGGCILSDKERRRGPSNPVYAKRGHHNFSWILCISRRII